MTGVPLDKAFLMLLEGLTPCPPHKKNITHQKNPPLLQGTNHANDIFYINKLKTQKQLYFYTYIFFYKIIHTININSFSHSNIIQSEKRKK